MLIVAVAVAVVSTVVGTWLAAWLHRETGPLIVTVAAGASCSAYCGGRHDRCGSRRLGSIAGRSAFGAGQFRLRIEWCHLDRYRWRRAQLAGYGRCVAFAVWRGRPKTSLPAEASWSGRPAFSATPPKQRGRVDGRCRRCRRLADGHPVGPPKAAPHGDWFVPGVCIRGQVGPKAIVLTKARGGPVKGYEGSSPSEMVPRVRFFF